MGARLAGLHGQSVFKAQEVRKCLLPKPVFLWPALPRDAAWLGPQQTPLCPRPCPTWSVPCSFLLVGVPSFLFLSAHSVPGVMPMPFLTLECPSLSPLQAKFKTFRSLS